MILGGCTVNFDFTFAGITWSPQYYLNILSEDCQHTFEGFADINNQTKQEFKINRTELISGDAFLGIRQNTKYGVRNRRCASESSMMMDEEDQEEDTMADLVDRSTMRTIDSLPEFAGKTYVDAFFPMLYFIGLYFYSISQPFHLLAKSTLSLPFINASIRLNKFVGLTLPFSTKQSQTGKMKRKYRVESIDKFIPAGSLTIREQGRLIGTTNLPNLAVGEKQILTCGQDPDVSASHIYMFPVEHDPIYLY